MEDYETMDINDVQEKAKWKNKDVPDYKDACCEMIWRLNGLHDDPAYSSDDETERCAWQDFWFERAADAGHIDAKGTYARMLSYERLMDKEWRQKAVQYFQELVDDFDAGRLTGEDRGWGSEVKVRLGIMLCQGYHTQRDAIKGVKLIKEAETLTKGFNTVGYKILNELGYIYASGLAQEDENPSIIDDFKQAVKYLDAAISRFNPEKDDPNNRGFLSLTQQIFENTKKLIEDPRRFKKLSQEEKDERRKNMMKLSDASIESIKADKAAFKRLTEHLERKGY